MSGTGGDARSPGRAADRTGRSDRPAPASDPVRLEVFRHLFASVAEEMGVVLRRSAYSPNIKERRDFSCAVFDAEGRMVAQAAHIPVHLGSMPLSVRACIERLDLSPGDVAILNDPFAGGTHLPDITIVVPVHAGGELLGFTASRAHHADVGGSAPGSMPLARELYQEGLVIPPLRLVEAGEPVVAVRDLILANVRTPEEREGDLRAQVAASRRGAERLAGLVDRYGRGSVTRHMRDLLEYAERLTRGLLRDLPDGEYVFEDAMEGDGRGGGAAAIRAAVTIEGNGATVDFTGTSPQRESGINAVYAITLSATLYVFRSLLGGRVPTNDGCLAPIRLIAPEGTLVNARRPAAVAGGNVETSQRIVDVLLGALAGAAPDRVPAGSQGTMNNLLVGGRDPARNRPYTYYETIGGGAGAGDGRPGRHAVHTHMTNTMNTPAEAIEHAYPLRVRRSEVRRGSGGAGRFPGGDGIVREIEFLAPARVTLLGERRVRAPHGLAGGGDGATGRDLLLRGGEWRELPAKGSFDVEAGDRLRIETPGGGGWGEPGVSGPG